MRLCVTMAAALAVACGAKNGVSAASGSPGSGGSSPQFGGPGPWGLDNLRFDSSNGIEEQPVVGASTDEAQNLWVATNSALYLLKHGEKTFRRFDAANGLHLMTNAVQYCDSNFTGGDRACPIAGSAASPGISEITGGAAGEVFVGYYGIDDGTGEWDDPNRHTGKLDRVRLQADGSLQVVRIDLVASNSPQFWHNRTIQRLVYDHFKHAHELYVGTNHGVTRLWPDKYREPGKSEWFHSVFNEYAADHLHPQVCYHMACGSGETGLRLGDWKGLALTPDGDLWVGGRWTGGLINWTDKIDTWWNRPGDSIFKIAFGDPYVAGKCNADGFCNQPVFKVPAEGDIVSIQAVAVAADGRVWFASGKTTTQDTPRGLAVWDWNKRNFQYLDPVKDAGMAENDVRDMVALPDGRLVLAGPNSGLTVWNPSTGAHVALKGATNLPDDHVMRLELDRMVEPPTLYVSTYGGVAALRKLP